MQLGQNSTDHPTHSSTKYFCQPLDSFSLIISITFNISNQPLTVNQIHLSWCLKDWNSYSKKPPPPKTWVKLPSLFPTATFEPLCRLPAVTSSSLARDKASAKRTCAAVKPPEQRMLFTRTWDLRRNRRKCQKINGKNAESIGYWLDGWAIQPI